MALFPGIDPYVEAQGYWPDFRVRFITYWRDALADRLPDAYEVRMDERVNLVDLATDRVKRVEPDLAIAHEESSSRRAPAHSGVATLEPVTIPLVIEEEQRETYVEILHRPDRTLVAVLELLSLTTKQEPGRRLYLTRRNALLHQNIHLVELDFLLGGQRLPLEKPNPPGRFFILIARAELRPDCQVYRWSVQDPLPAIPIPLVKPDPDLIIDLAAVYSTAFERGRYSRSIDYGAALSANLTEVEGNWIQERVQAKAK
jgi:hypothetical protein